MGKSRGRNPSGFDQRTLESQLCNHRGDYQSTSLIQTYMIWWSQRILMEFPSKCNLPKDWKMNGQRSNKQKIKIVCPSMNQCHININDVMKVIMTIVISKAIITCSLKVITLHTINDMWQEIKTTYIEEFLYILKR